MSVFTEDVTMDQISVQAGNGSSFRNTFLDCFPLLNKPKEPPKEKPKITMKFQKNFLDFSQLNLEYLNQLAAKVAILDYGRYFPSSVKVLVRPLPPFSTFSNDDIALIEKADYDHMQEEIDKENSEIQGNTKGNFFDKVKAAMASTIFSAANRAVKLAELIRTGSVEYLIDSFTLQRFQSLNLPEEERFIYEFHCSTTTGDSVACGFLYLTQHFLIFQGKKKNVKFEQIRFSLPLWRVVSLHRAKTTKSLVKPPSFSCVDLATYADAALIYTEDYKVHIFFDFVSIISSNSVQEFMHVFDYDWRALANGEEASVPEDIELDK